MTGGALPGACYYTDGNLGKQVKVSNGLPPVNMPYYETPGLTLIDKNGAPGNVSDVRFPK